MRSQYFLQHMCKLFAVFLVVILPTSAIAQSGNSQKNTVTDMFACRTIDNADARLVCYDKAVGRFEEANTSGEIVTMTKPDVEKIQKDAFGFNVPSILKFGKMFGISQDTPNTENETKAEKKRKKKLKKQKKSAQAKVVLKIAKTKKFGYNKLRFYFENGQVWEQIESKELIVKKNRPADAHILRASLGSFLLRINGKGKAVRVRRIK